MFVRWKRYYNHVSESHAIAAYLVSSMRRDGKPRQRVVRYLASIQIHRIALNICRKLFWRKVDRALAQGYGINKEDRDKYETAIARKVPRP